jgi:trehalose-6-phosphatase
VAILTCGPRGLTAALGGVTDLRRTVVAIDFDGTLSPVTPHPRQARIGGIDKGTALQRLVDGGSGAVVFAGDDVGDLPAFAWVRRWSERTALPGITIGVVPDGGSPISGEADWEVRDSTELGETLSALGS